MEKRGFKNAKIKKPCVTADYAQDDLHIDYPIYQSNDSDLDLGIGKKHSNADERFWDESDPRGLIDWINNDTNHNNILCSLTSEEKEQFRKITKYLKRWRDEQYTSLTDRSKVYSIGLTIMVREQFSPEISDEGIHNDFLALKNVVNKILESDYFIDETDDKFSIEVELPVNPYRDVFNKHGITVGTKLNKKLKRLLEKLEKVEEEDDLVKQCEILENQLGSDFPIPEKNNKNSNKVTNSSAGIVGSSQGA